MNRKELADGILARMNERREDIATQWRASAPIHHFVLDDVLPPATALRIRKAYPAGDSMRVRKSLRELKFVAAQMDQYDPILEEILFAFQDPRIVALVEEITGLKALEPDDLLYAGGISMMAKGHFLNPHLDNSHDKERERYRVLNLLYYVSEDWGLKDGGNLELWPEGPKAPQVTVESRFNRLAVMITNSGSWHSVSPVKADRPRCCVSNYYFSKHPAEGEDYFHVTTFRGRPEQVLRDVALRADSALRMGVRKLFPKGAVKTDHYYKK
ncbi:2OG-Fe(II) oxygenase [Roseateles chitinivorans]|uniref:2OG-Fe(II) oxygenase n=1 Tax=Roseateles chitinivorans TaxID=2917965 RepID=UPI003D67E785